MCAAGNATERDTIDVRASKGNQFATNLSALINAHTRRFPCPAGRGNMEWAHHGPRSGWVLENGAKYASVTSEGEGRRPSSCGDAALGKAVTNREEEAGRTPEGRSRPRAEGASGPKSEAGEGVEA